MTDLKPELEKSSAAAASRLIEVEKESEIVEEKAAIVDEEAAKVGVKMEKALAIK